MKLSDINEKNGFGRLLLAAITILTTENFTDKTPDEVLELLNQKATDVWGALEPVGGSPGPFGLLHLGRGTFGLAIEAAKQGKLISRSGWNGKGMFVFLRPEDKLSPEMVVNKVKSLPKSLKDWIYNNGPLIPLANRTDDINFTAYFCMKAADGSIVNGWLASQTDMLAEDWTIIE